MERGFKVSGLSEDEFLALQMHRQILVAETPQDVASFDQQMKTRFGPRVAAQIAEPFPETANDEALARTLSGDMSFDTPTRESGTRNSRPAATTTHHDDEAFARALQQEHDADEKLAVMLMQQESEHYTQNDEEMAKAYAREQERFRPHPYQTPITLGEEDVHAQQRDASNVMRRLREAQRQQDAERRHAERMMAAMLGSHGPHSPAAVAHHHHHHAPRRPSVPRGMHRHYHVPAMAMMMGMGGFPPGASEIDIDSMDYDALLELGERLGDAKPVDQQALAALKSALPSRKMTADDIKARSEEERRCTICMDDYSAGDEVKSLTCFHSFHSACIDRWMQTKTTCPVCQTDQRGNGS